MKSRISDAARDLRRAIEQAKAKALGSSKPEAVLREAVQPVLGETLRQAGLRSRVRDEMPLSVPAIDAAAALHAPLEGRGRADAVYNRFVIEFEPPGSLRASKQHSATRHAVQQVQQYLRGLAEEYGLSLERLAGCAFDGDWLVYVGWDREGWTVSRPRQADPDALDALCRTLTSMAEGRGLTASNLIEDFGRDGDIASAMAGALHTQFSQDRATPRAHELFQQWSTDLGRASGPFASADLSGWKELCDELHLPSKGEWAPHVLFCLQTYFALVAKLVGLIILEGTYEVDLLDSMLGEPRDAFLSLERGVLTSDLGVADFGAANLVEPGIFSWYAQDAYEAVPQALNSLLETAREYSAELGALEPPNARDLLKDLYQSLVPGTLRHRLGEYYTPDWLALHVLDQVVRRPLTPTTRVLDPACGSGTFLVMAARRMLSAGSGSAKEQISQLTQSLIGFDLSPLAVQAAKVNYLLAVAPTLRQTGQSISIPVFLADSVAPPRRGGLLEGDSYVVSSSVGEWRVPTYVVENPDLFHVLGRSFSKALADDDLSGADVVEMAEESHPGIPDSAKEGIADLYGRLYDLHFHRRDGMWWNLLSNAFAPRAHRNFEYVIGNPPWVAWETLPEAYRRENDSLWRQYGLHPDTPPNRSQRSRNVPLDLSMLFVARCVDRYLDDGGRLGFVITASVFKSELSGRGFRRRRLPGGGVYAFELVEDLTRLQIFEDATNQTSVLIAVREGKDPPFPIEAEAWLPAETAAIPTHSHLNDVLGLVQRISLKAEPVSPRDLASPLLMLPKEALRLSRPMRRYSPYAADVRNGVHTRGANGVFFLEILETLEGNDVVRVRNLPGAGRKGGIPQVTAEIEAGAVRRLLRGEDVSRGEAKAELGLLFFHDREHTSRPIPDAVARERFPRAYEFASEFEDVLRRRRRFRNFDPRGEEWLGLYSVTGPALAEHKVVYREIAQGTIAAPVRGAHVVPDHKLYVIGCRSAAEARLLSKVMNSDVVDYIVRAFSISTSITGSLLRYVGIRRIDAELNEDLDDKDLASVLGLSPESYRRLAELSLAGFEGQS